MPLVDMVDIGTSDKITNLWPVPPGRRIDRSGAKDKDGSSHNQQNKHKQKDKSDIKQDGPGKNIDEYA